MLPSDITVESPKVRACLDYALSLVGACETPPGSNRGADIDAWAKEFGSPLGSYWCALFVGHVRKKHGLWVPSSGVGSCDEWVKQARAKSLWTNTPTPGCAVVYHNGTTHKSGPYKGQLDAHHIGLVLRVTPARMSIEGNTTLEGFSRNGEVVTLKAINAGRVYGYINSGV